MVTFIKKERTWLKYRLQCINASYAWNEETQQERESDEIIPSGKLCISPTRKCILPCPTDPLKTSQRTICYHPSTAPKKYNWKSSTWKGGTEMTMSKARLVKELVGMEWNYKWNSFHTIILLPNWFWKWYETQVRRHFYGIEKILWSAFN